MEIHCGVAWLMYYLSAETGGPRTRYLVDVNKHFISNGCDSLSRNQSKRQLMSLL